MSPTTLHVVSLPHTKLTPDFSACAFTTKVRLFSEMMTERGHNVILYGPEGNEANCTEFVQVLSDEEQRGFFGPVDHRNFYPLEFDENLPYWKLFNERVAKGIKLMSTGKDIHCTVAGRGASALAASIGDIPTVEFAIGYAGIFSHYRVFESYAWMHHLYGRYGIHDGAYYDAVIPSYVRPDEFPQPADDPDDYLLFVGRIIERKGLHIAIDVAKTNGRKIKVVGQGAFSPEPGVLVSQDRSMQFEYEGLEFLGNQFPAQRNDLMRNAAALLAPTVYIEPFGNVAMEAQLCGTPVISSDWGAFTETVAHGISGFRCRTMDQYFRAVKHVGDLDRDAIRARATDLWSFDSIGPMYEEFFRQLHFSTSPIGWYYCGDDSSMDWLKR